MIPNCLGHLPIEIIQKIFCYLSAHEILQAFSNLNSFFDGILSTYPYYRLNFKSISRANFDFVCEHIMPNQVVSLVLSDLEDTPGQAKLFFSHFQLADFTRLQMVKLIKIDYISMFCIDPYLTIFNNNHKLSIETEMIDTDIFKYNHSFLPQIFAYATEIKIDRITGCLTSSLSYLRYLTVSTCSMAELQKMCLLAEKLKSIKVKYLRLDPDNACSLIASQLTRLVLHCVHGNFHLEYISNYQILSALDVFVSIDQIEQLLLNLTRLKYFEILCKGLLDLANGQSWEKSTDQLITFNFNFLIDTVWNETSLDSFRTPFWIEEKKWFVACTSERIFTVPHFFDNTADSFFELPLDTTIPEEIRLLDKVNHFIIYDSSDFPHFQFRHVETLEILNLNACVVEDLLICIDLKHVKNLILSIVTPTTIFSLIDSMPSVKTISLNTKLTHLFNQTNKNDFCFKQIRVLELNEPIVDDDFNVLPQLVRLFPNVEVLNVKFIQRKLGIVYLIDRFPNLSSVSFNLLQPNTTTEQYDDEISMRKYITDNIEYLNEKSCTCRSEAHFVSKFAKIVPSFQFWIRKPSTTLPNQYWLPERGYKYYYIQFLLEYNIFFRITVSFLQLCLLLELEFLLAYTLGNIMNSQLQFLIIIIQVMFLLIKRYLQKLFKDPLISKFVGFFLHSLFVLVCHIMHANWQASFFYSLYYISWPFQLFVFNESDIYCPENWFAFYGVLMYNYMNLAVYNPWKTMNSEPLKRVCQSLIITFVFTGALTGISLLRIFCY